MQVIRVAEHGPTQIPTRPFSKWLPINHARGTPKIQKAIKVYSEPIPYLFEALRTAPEETDKNLRKTNK